MSRLLPTPMLPLAGVLAFVLVWPRLRTQPSTPRLAAEAFGFTLVSIGILWAGWVALWLIEQRW